MRCLAVLAALILGADGAAAEVASAPGAILRTLDKMTGRSMDVEVDVGGTESFGRLVITLADCRYPTEDPASNAYALIEILERGKEGRAFSGWMIANAPALNPLDHPRYDVWVLRCRFERELLPDG